MTFRSLYAENVQYKVFQTKWDLGISTDSFGVNKPFF